MIHPLASMRRRFSSLPIRIKLLVIIVGICGSALLLSGVFEIALNWKSGRAVALNRLEANAGMIALQSQASLAFVDAAAAREILATLRANPSIRRACLYNEAGEEFASYLASNVMPDMPDGSCPTARPQGEKEHWNRLAVSRDIVASGGNKLGNLFIEMDLEDVYRQLYEQIVYQLLVIIGVTALVWLFSFYFQRMISRPIIQLAENSWRFSLDRGQRIHIVKTSDDEIGKLVDAFNGMMDEIRRNEGQLEHAIAELTRSNTELERFAHICSHDLQEPLRMVSSYAKLLEKNCRDNLPPEGLDYLSFITDGADRMRALIKDILAYARIGHQAEPMQRVDVAKLVDYALKNMSATIEERQAIIHIGALPEVTGNKTLLLQMFQNLISNAIKFSTETPEIWIEAVRADESWQFSVRDRGIGIDPRYHDKIFEIFKRLNRREEFQGTGIGLAIFKKAVEYHGGRAWVDSEPGKGTTFFFILPDKAA